jgi:hypothetical protein
MHLPAGPAPTGAGVHGIGGRAPAGGLAPGRRTRGRRARRAPPLRIGGTTPATRCTPRRPYSPSGPNPQQAGGDSPRDLI